MDRLEVESAEIHRLVVKIRRTVTEKFIDSMGVLYYGAYSSLFDLARMALYRAYGYPEPETVSPEGWFMPVLGFNLKVFQASRLGDELEIKAWWHKFKGPRMWMGAQIFNAKSGKLVAQGYTEHCFVDENTFKILKPDPNWNICLKFRQGY